MPELPEVETTLRGIAPHVIGVPVKRVKIRQAGLRLPVPKTLSRSLTGKAFTGIQRRAKYLLFENEGGTMLLHLGMTGSLRVVDADSAFGKHDHVDFEFSGGKILRYTDPRRFGLITWTRQPVTEHALLRHLGPEPLARDFDGDHLFRHSRKRKVPVKQFIMDGKIVVGVGNIYASESLFLAGVRPGRAAGRISRREYQRIARAVKQVLRRAIKKGGTTLRNFVQPDGETGYFSINLNVYDRAGEPCKVCAQEIRQRVMGQRSTYWCPACQA